MIIRYFGLNAYKRNQKLISAYILNSRYFSGFVKELVV